MNKFAKIIFWCTVGITLLWFLPWIYALCTPSATDDPFYGFSPVSNDWVSSKDTNKSLRDSLLPQLYYRQLLADDRLPDSLCGKELSAHNLRTHEVVFTVAPREIVARKPRVWMMMESMPKTVDLEDPKEVFRFTDDGRMEFVDIATNAINPSRSKRFTETLRARGFAFPAKYLSANVTSRKAYDEGYLMVDADGKVFHVKQQVGRPYVAAVKLPDSVRARYAFIWEQPDCDLLGMIVDESDRPWIIEHDGYRAIPFPDGAGTFDPEAESATVMGNLFNLTCRFSTSEGSRWVAIDADDYRLLDTLTYRRPRPRAAEVADYLFPVVLNYTSTTDSLAYPRLERVSAKALPLWLLIAAAVGFLVWRRRKIS